MVTGASMKKLVAVLTALLVMIGGNGCGLTEPGPILDEFSWEGVAVQDDITEGVTIAAFFGDISFLGQFKTPTLCYNIGSTLETNGNALTIRVDATATNQGTCGQAAGGFRYTGVVRNLSAGTYTVKIIQTVGGVGTTEFVQEVKL
jgi:hypothetical protein